MTVVVLRLLWRVAEDQGGLDPPIVFVMECTTMELLQTGHYEPATGEVLDNFLKKDKVLLVDCV